MASLRQIKANRRNAALSTGPTSQTGRRRAGQNAWRHGLSATKPDPKATLAYYRAILQDPDASLLGALSNPAKSAAMTLAQCQARIFKLRKAITRLDRKITPLMARLECEGLLAEHQDALGELLAVAGLPTRLAKDPQHWIFEVIKLEGDISLLEPLRQELDARRKVDRYLLEAEGTRKRALYAYLDCLEEKSFSWRGSDEIDAFEAEFTLADLGL